MRKSLVGKYPNSDHGKNRKTPGQDLFDAFQPCYIRAFMDAADYTDGKKAGKPHKGSRPDDVVDKGEFGLLCAYLCIYATMVRQLISHHHPKLIF